MGDYRYMAMEEDFEKAQICTVCGGLILPSEDDFIVNRDGEFAHEECLDEKRDLIEFLGGDYVIGGYEW